MTVINFYSTKDQYGGFSNFSRHPFELDGKQWLTTEHYFQAQKFPGNEAYQEKIRLEKSPMVAARRGRSRAQPIRPDWEQVKDELMKAALLAKVRQNKDIREILLSTGDAQLVEHTKNDRYWGDGGDGSGKNKLGLLLMEIREKLRQEAK